MASSVGAAKCVPADVALADRLADRRVRMALDHRPEAVVEVVHLVAVDVPHARPVAVLEVDRPRLAQLIGGGDAAGEDVAGAVVHPLRGLRALVEALLLALGQLLDALAVELCGSGGHAVSLGAQRRTTQAN